MRSVFLHIAVLIALTFLCSPARSQENDATLKLRLAQSFEQSGEWERAVELYEGLYRSDPNSYVYFDGLRRGYTQLRRYDEAIRLIETQLQKQPADVGLLASLGGIFYESGSGQSADSVWNHIIGLDPRNAGLYRMVAAQMMEHRLYERAVNTYLAGRKATGNDNAFADELATMYLVLQQYTAASTEFVKMLKLSPQQLPFVQSRIAAFTIRNEGLKAATDVTREEVRKNPDDVTLRKLSAWLAMEGKDYRTALEEYRTVEKLSGSSGAELLSFANRASQDGQDRIATEAFHDIIGLSRVPTIVSQARFGYARSMEDLSTKSDSSGAAATRDPSPDKSQSGTISEIQKSYQDIVSLYEGVIRDYPNSDLAAQSLYRIGIIRMERFLDFSGAIDVFTKVKKTAQAPELACDASVKIAEVYVSENDLRSARREYRGLTSVPLPLYQQRALFSLGELDYFEGSFDSALAKLKPLAANLNSDLSNNVLTLQYFISENNTSNTAALVEYAKADLLMRQQRYSESLVLCNDIVRQFPTSLLVDDATMKMGELQLLLKQTDEALSAFRRVVQDMPESILRDHAQMKIAETYQFVLKDKAKAIEAYEFILAKFPHSLYLEEARKRIRKLRGDPT